MELTEMQQEVFDSLLARTGPVSAGTLAYYMDWRYDQVHKHLISLERKGHVRREGHPALWFVGR